MLLRFLCMFVAASMLMGLPYVYAEQPDEAMTAFRSGNYQKALSIWASEAEKGDASAQVNLGAMYARGVGVEKSRPEALKWFEKAADQGSAEAMFSLGKLHETRYGEILPDYDQSFDWYTKAAEKGSANAQYALGASYFKGRGTTTDYVSAYAWMDVARRNGHPTAEVYRDTVGDALSSDDLGRAKQVAEEIYTRLEKP